MNFITAGDSRDYVWSNDETPCGNKNLFAASRISARLDYRVLWKTYFLHRQKTHIDWWSFLIRDLIPDIEMPNGISVEGGWNNMLHSCSGTETFDLGGDDEVTVDDVMNYIDIDYMRENEGSSVLGEKKDANVHTKIAATALERFSQNLTFTLENIQEEAQSMLNILSPGMRFNWNVTAPYLKGYSSGLDDGHTYYYLADPKIVIEVEIAGNKLKNHHNLLNEARLSALALSIYLAAAKINAIQARSVLKVLALDDVLIGLDMSNRMPVLEVLSAYFSDWQIFLFTYDRAWYELAKSRLNKERWKHFEFFASDEVPIWDEDCGALEKSKSYLKSAQNLVAPDYKAAGVWARSAFEWMMKWFCDKHQIPIPYNLDDRFLQAETLWLTLKQVEVEIVEKQGAPLVKRKLISEKIGEGVKRCKSQHLNPLCHANLNAFDAREVGVSIQALEALQTELNRDFHSVSLPQKAAEQPEKKITDYDIENLPRNVQEAVYRRAGKSLGYLPGKAKKEGGK